MKKSLIAHIRKWCRLTQPVYVDMINFDSHNGYKEAYVSRKSLLNILKDFETEGGEKQ